MRTTRGKARGTCENGPHEQHARHMRMTCDDVRTTRQHARIINKYRVYIKEVLIKNVQVCIITLTCIYKSDTKTIN
jgi:hypothetical protein